MVKPEIVEFAKSKGFEDIKYIREWRGFKCYELILRKGKVSFTGMPLLALEDSKGNIRISTAKESFEWLGDVRRKKYGK